MTYLTTITKSSRGRGVYTSQSLLGYFDQFPEVLMWVDILEWVEEVLRFLVGDVLVWA